MNLSERIIGGGGYFFAVSKSKLKIMQKKKLIIVITLLCAFMTNLQAQYAENDTTYKKCFVGSSLFLLGNLSSVNRPDFGQLNLGYRITGKDVVALELRTWKYAWPLGIHPIANDAYGTPEEEFPGYIREYGFALAYQRFLLKGLYAEINMMNAWQTFVDNSGQKIDNGFQIFNTYRVGYHVKLFKDKFFIQPSIAITHRPYHTKMPDGFKEIDDKWSKFLFAEPAMHFGFNF